MKKIFINLFWAVAILGISACTTKVEPSADIPEVSFRDDIFPILNSNCTVSGCHDGFSDASALITQYDMIYNGGVVPGDPHGSKIYEVIRLYSGEDAMPPPPSDPLSDAQIGMIYVWILQGAKDN